MRLERLLFLAFSVVLAGCQATTTSIPTPAGEAAASVADELPDIQVPEDKALLYLYRTEYSDGWGQTYRVAVNSRPVADVKIGTRFEHVVPAGGTVLQARTLATPFTVLLGGAGRHGTVVFAAEAGKVYFIDIAEEWGVGPRFDFVDTPTALAAMKGLKTAKRVESPQAKRSAAVVEVEAAMEAETECRPFKRKAESDIGLFEFERRREIYAKTSALTVRLFKCCEQQTIAERHVPIFEPVPILALIDRDGDGRADEFLHKFDDGKPSADRGAIFDLNDDGRIDYIVFIGGIGITDRMTVTPTHYHLIDSNYDGVMDISVYNVDRDGNQRLDEGVTAWVYDRDFDGTLDDGEYLGPGVQELIEKTAKGLLVKGWPSDKVLDTETPILLEFNALLREMGQSDPESVQ